MKKEVLSINNNSTVKEIELSDKIWNCEISEGAIYHIIRNNLANARVGTASTKTRSEVAGTHKKPWSQKKLGRARAGRRQSPVWVGGGITFGPKPRDYTYNLPKKMKRRALFSILTLKNKDGHLKIIENFDVESGKTKDLVSLLEGINQAKNKRTLFVLSEKFYSDFENYKKNNFLPSMNKHEEKSLRRRLSSGLRRAARNIPYIDTISYKNLRAHNLYYHDNIVFLEESALKLDEFYKEK